MRITRLPASLVRREHGLLKDHVVLLDEDRPQPLAWRVHATFAGYLAGQMAALVESPDAVSRLERRAQSPALTPEARTLFQDMVRTARRRQRERQPAQ